MIIDSNNREVLHSLSFSDYLFSGFSYEYDVNMLTFSCLDQSEDRRFRFSFHQTVLFSMQSCNLWGCGNAIYDISYQDDSLMLSQINQLKANNQGNIDKSKLDDEVDYLCLSVCLNSGDELLIACQSVEILCDNAV